MSTVHPSQAVAPFVVSLDVGTSSTRALLFDARARHVAGMEARVGYALQETADGGVELDADRLVGAALECLDGLYRESGGLAAGVRVGGACTFWHSVVGVDAPGAAITPVFLWADVRSRSAAARMRQELDEGDYHRRTGCVFHHSYVPAKLAWLRDCKPSLFERVRRWMSFGEYLYVQLLGSTRSSFSMASGSGLFDQHMRRWDQPILRHVGLEEAQLPELADLDAELPPLSPHLAARWPDWENIRWILPVGDGATSNLGSGCVDSDRIALMVGTSGAMRACWESDSFEIRDGLWCYRADGRRILMGGALSNGGILFPWLEQTFNLPPREDLQKELADAPADSHGLTMLPFLLGERSPEWADHARGAIVGLTLQTTPVQIVQAALEAVACRFALIETLLRGVVDPHAEIVATGGALLSSEVWMQMMADVLGRPILASEEEEASSRGTTLLALRELGVISDLGELPAATGRAFEPDSGRHEVYLKAIERQRKYFSMLVQ